LRSLQEIQPDFEEEAKAKEEEEEAEEAEEEVRRTCPTVTQQFLVFSYGNNLIENSLNIDQQENDGAPDRSHLVMEAEKSLTPLHQSLAAPYHETQFIPSEKFSSTPKLPPCLCCCGFQTKMLYAFLVSKIRAICPYNIILLDLITITIFGEEKF
jgi:hypothetical protein